MPIDRKRFCLNRKVAPNVPLARFFALVQRIGLDKVELRNDLASGAVTDGLSYSQVRDLAASNGVRIVTINAAQRFNQLTRRTREAAEGLLRDAQGVGAQAVVMCPLNDGTPVPRAATVDAIRQLTELFGEYGIDGLVEPLGFQQSSLRSAVEAQQLIREAGSPFKILVDSFHHYLYENAEDEFPQHIDVSRVGLVHLSGIESTKSREEMVDQDRILLTDRDVMKSAWQAQRIEKLGYKGVYSFEPFSDTLGDWSEGEIERQVNRSIDLVNAEI